MRNIEPNVSIYDKLTVESYKNQIKFLLKAEGINIDEEKSDYSTNFYLPKSNKHDAKVFVKDGQFILLEGSIIKHPGISTEKYNDKGKFYDGYTNYINDFLADSKIQGDGDNYKTLINLTFTSPSGVASLISGLAENGWKFFEGIEELRK